MREPADAGLLVAPDDSALSATAPLALAVVVREVAAARHGADVDDDALAGPTDALEVLQRGRVRDVVRRRLPVGGLDGLVRRRQLAEHGVSRLLVVQARGQQQGIEP